MRTLITGATGFVGANLLVHLWLSGKKLRATYRSAAGFDELKLVADFYRVDFGSLFREVEWVKVDLLDKVALDRAMFDIEELYHCAAIVSFDSSSANRVLTTNVEGTENVMKACLRKEINKVCYISSIGALSGTNEKGFVDETCFHEKRLGSVYAISKYRSEKVVWEAIEQGLKVVVLNPGIILGPGNFQKGSLQFFDAVKKGIKFYSYGVTGYVDVRDLCKAAIYAMEHHLFNKRYILVSENLSYKQLFRLIANYLDVKPPYIAAGKILLGLALFLANIKGKITGKPQRFTKETLSSATKVARYDATLAREDLQLHFISMDQTIRELCEWSKNRG